MRASRGMGAIKPSKMPSGKKTPRRDDTDFTEFKKGGKVKLPSTSKAPKVKKYAEGGESKVNEAGNYTKPSKREALFKSIKASATHGTAAGQ